MKIYTPKRKRHLFLKKRGRHLTTDLLYAITVSVGAMALILTASWPKDHVAHAEPKPPVEVKIEPSSPPVEPVIVHPDVEKAEEMLVGTPMAGLGKLIVETSNAKGVDWRIVIGIAEAESNRGESYVYEYDKDHCHNAWGIKPKNGRRSDGSYLRCYYDWEAGVNTITGVLSRRYKGWTVEQMNGVYVQPKNQNWVNTINLFVKS